MRNTLKSKIRKGSLCKYRPVFRKPRERIAFSICYNDQPIRASIACNLYWDNLTKDEVSVVLARFDEIVEFIKEARNLKSILDRFGFLDLGKKERIVHYSSEFRDTDLLFDNIYALELFSKKIESKYGASHDCKFIFRFIVSPVINGKCRIVLLNDW